jgi:CRISPR-associated protein (TIGR03986 family)
LVVSGQPGARVESEHKGKYKEYCFRPFESINQEIVVNNEDFKRFESIHSNSVDYVDLWAPILKSGKPIPVFYNNMNDEHCNIGLTMMFRYPTEHNVEDNIPKELQDKTIKDMADLIFGYAEDNDSLKGRVQFGHAFLHTEEQEGNMKGKVCVGNEVPYILSTPHASYYPIYLKSDNTENPVPVTWRSGSAIISGFKRYPVLGKTCAPQLGNDANTNMLSKMCPLKAGSVFKSKVVFHNLRPAELGALLYTITLLDYHQLGGCKPYGYGAVKIEPTLTLRRENTPLATYKEYVDKFKNLFTENSDSIKQLKEMANGIEKDNLRNEFKYMSMSTDSESNEFKIAKDNGEYLGYFTQIKESRRW